ncbi:SAM dependent carboxyl methyltransferase [Corchorus olitorius]|uniref:SAM dependent carboxyl methyltransferase n=1 Tax=Corchorus olitorius TaxID=93759 RepID=A0A1R3I0Z3_9ROSI|nr:SAM dependent carboxyl methyltransferase [Corchorus olitorius]
MAMEVKEMLFMNTGDGENSYVKNAAYTPRIAAVTQAILYNTVQSFIRENCSSQFEIPKVTSEGGLPLNKGKIYISKTSLPAVIKAYLTQFQEDFISFLKCRSLEMVSNGRMVLIIHGRESEDPTTDRDHNYIWEVLGNAISCMVSQGLIDEEKLDTFNIPYYIALKDEVEDLVKKEGSFTTEFIDLIAINILDMTPESKAKTIRSFTESIISTQFGEEIMDKLYDKVTEIIVEDSKLGKEVTKRVSNVVVLKKIK